MKKAVGYVRISRADQSTFSLDGQEEYIRTHCSRAGITLLSIFRDDGQSAKSFDRASWRELETFIKEHRREVDYLVVMKYDRFSRNVADALAMIDKLEKKFSITIISVMEPIGLHPSSPYFFQFRTQMLLGAEVELRVIKDRTKFGMVTGARSGRYMSHAPAGYVNAKDTAGKRTLAIDPAAADLIREVYALYLANVPLTEIARQLKAKGLKLSGNSAVQRVLTYPVYAGLIRVPAYYDEPEQLVKGLHDPIVDEGTWWRVQRLLKAPAVQRTTLSEEVPLRGVLSCSCGRHFTAGKSKGRNAHYWYYRCNGHTGTNLSAGQLHLQFDQVLEYLSLPAHIVDGVALATERKLKLEEASSDQRAREIRTQLRTIGTKLESLEEKYLNNTIDSGTYQKWRGKLATEQAQAQSALQQATAPAAGLWALYAQVMPKLSDLKYLYNLAPVASKQQFLRIVFNNDLRYVDGSYRTAGLMQLFAANAVILKEKQLLFVEQPFGNPSGFPLVAETGAQLNQGTTAANQLIKILEWAASVKEAA